MESASVGSARRPPSPVPTGSPVGEAMNETSKCRAIRERLGHFDTYLCGRGIDIGSGADPLVVPHGSVLKWDRNDGDAQHLAGLEDKRFDFAYSSHCLEHICNIAESVRNWVRVVRPGGFCISACR